MTPSMSDIMMKNGESQFMMIGNSSSSSRSSELRQAFPGLLYFVNAKIIENTFMSGI